VPEPPFVGSMESGNEAAAWAVVWLPEGGDPVTESYVNLIPTVQGGTHVNGLRTGLTEAVREFCEFRNLLPRGVKLAPEDVWARASWILSVKLAEPQFSGQTKERLSSRECAAFVSGVVKDAFSLWLNEHVGDAERIAELAIGAAQARLRAGRKVTRKKITQGPALPGKLADCTSTDPERSELFLVEGDSAGGSAKQARDREFQAIMPLRGKILNTWEVDPAEVLGSQEVHDIAVAIGVDPGSDDLSAAALRQGLHPGRRRLRRRPHRDPALRPVLRHFPAPGGGGACLCRHAAAVSHRRRQAGLLRPRRRRAPGRARPHRRREAQGQGQRAALQGPRRDEPAAAARDHHPPGHPPPGAADG
jgi:DNA gyrase/topoisomerase IV subunit B